MTSFWNNLHQVKSKSKDWKVKNFGNNKTKGPKQDNQNRLRPTMPEGVLIIIILFRNFKLQ
jgi:hypothetical protein